MKLPNEISQKKILIYGLGKSGRSSLKYLKKKNKCFVYDDNSIQIEKNIKKFYISKSVLKKNLFDYIVLSPGINSRKCSLSNYLKMNKEKILTEFDIFYIFQPRIISITITGTNGKTTTCKLLHDILKNHGIDARLTGNIGNPLLAEKNIRPNTIFIVEASSYQLSYSKYFRSKFSIIINVSTDHLERHLTMENYIKSKLKSVTNQQKNDISIIQNNILIKKIIKKKTINSKIIYLKNNKYDYLKNRITNNYFRKTVNFDNIIFLFELSKYFNLKITKVLKSINNFKPLQFRQEIISNTKNYKIINDSKSTSLSSTIPFLETNERTFWILGGLIKKGDKFNLNKKFYKNITAFIYGRDKIMFSKLLKNKLKINLSENLSDVIKLISKKLKNEKKKTTILFSPSAASFDQFRNFEERGKRFNILIKKYLLN